MAYSGGKSRLVDWLIRLMQADLARASAWVEPFVGSGVVLAHVPPTVLRIGSDIHPYSIAVLRALQLGYSPPYVSKALYHDIRRCPHRYSPGLVGFAGFHCSFGGKWFGGYANATRNRDYPAEAGRIALGLRSGLRHARLKCCDYADLEVPENSIIYCDPPYHGTLGYGGTEPFDHTRFWAWAIQRAAEGHYVWVSEYSVPEWVPLIEAHEKSRASGMRTGTAIMATEWLVKIGA